MAIEVMLNHPDVSVGREGNLLVVVVTRALTNESYVQMYDQFDIAAKTSKQLSALTVIPRYDGPIAVDAATRKQQADRAVAVADHYVGAATVVPVTGLKGTVIRTAITAVHLLAVNPTPTKVFAAVEEAVLWLKGLPRQAVALASDPFLANTVNQYLASVLGDPKQAASGAG